MENTFAKGLAMISPFYWILQMVYHTLGGNTSFWFYAGLTALFCIISFVIIIISWSKTPFSRRLAV